MITPQIPDLYYYTTVETMRFILQNANIYATDLKYMNDSEEYSNGLRELRWVINSKYSRDVELIDKNRLCENIKEHSGIYSISFSVERDLLSQWSMYAKESGVSLKMNFNTVQEYYAYPDQSDKKERELITKLNLYPHKVYYFTKHTMSEKEYNKVKCEIIADIEKKHRDIEANAIEIWQDMTPYVKRYEFHAEGEYRLAFSMRTFAKKFQIDYRVDKHVLKPYLDVKCHNGWPIQEIIVGPGFNQQVVYDSIRHFMEHANLQVPLLDGKEFLKRCQLFLENGGDIPLVVKELLKKREAELKSENRFEKFKLLLKDIMMNTDIEDKYKNYISERDMSKDGIIISKSKIPYIY